jgi:hypothetical protein
MSMGKPSRDRQPPMWVTTTDLPTAASHPFYRRLNQVLRDEGFDRFAETQYAPFYAETMGRPGVAPGTYFRLLAREWIQSRGFDASADGRGNATRPARPPRRRIRVADGMVPRAPGAWTRIVALRMNSVARQTLRIRA